MESSKRTRSPIVVGLVTAGLVYAADLLALAFGIHAVLFWLNVPMFPILLLVGYGFNIQQAASAYVVFALAAAFWGMIASAVAWSLSRKVPVSA